MSSILDALNKLEYERVLAQRPLEIVEIDPVSAARELVGPSAFRDPVTLNVSLFTIIGAGSLFALVLVSLSVGATMLILGPSNRGVVEVASLNAMPPAGSAAIEPEGLPGIVPPALPEETPASIETPLPVDEAPSATEDPPKPQVDEAPAVSVAPSPPQPATELEAIVVTEKVARPAEDVLAKAETPADTPAIPEPPATAVVVEQEPTAVASISRPEVPGASSGESTYAQNAGMPAVESLVELPMLTRTDKERYADARLKINMVMPKSSTNPYGFAVIDRMKVYEGQSIPGTRLELIGVDIEGIGVLVQGSRLRYFVPF